MDNEMLVLTPSALVAFLSEIEELKGLDLELTENNNSLDIKIGDNNYKLESPAESVVEVNDEAMDELEDLNEDGYEELDDFNLEEDLEDVSGEAVEGGIIKELLKTLAVGGLVRLTKNAIANS